MNIVAMDGSGLVAGIAVMSDEKLLAEYNVNYKKTHSQTLLPMLDEVLKMLEMELCETDYIAVTNGPGSFTGLRICASTAKGLGLALDKPLVAVSSIEALAYNYEGSDKIICPIMDARRNQVYTGTFTFETTLQTLEEVCAEDIHETIKKVCLHAGRLGREVVFLGDGTAPYSKIIEEEMTVNYTIAPAQLCMQRASSVARAAFDMIKQGKTISAIELVPEYFRMSQAERERLERTGKK